MYDLKDVELAGALVRPQRLFSNEDIDTSLVLTPERYGSVNRIFVVSEKGKTLMKEFQLWMIKNNPPNHVEHIQDSDHMVMISRPLDLGDRLLSLAKKFAWKYLTFDSTFCCEFLWLSLLLFLCCKSLVWIFIFCMWSSLCIWFDFFLCTWFDFSTFATSAKLFHKTDQSKSNTLISLPLWNRDHEKAKI